MHVDMFRCSPYPPLPSQRGRPNCRLLHRGRTASHGRWPPCRRGCPLGSWCPTHSSGWWRRGAGRSPSSHPHWPRHWSRPRMSNGNYWGHWTNLFSWPLLCNTLLHSQRLSRYLLSVSAFWKLKHCIAIIWFRWPLEGVHHRFEFSYLSSDKHPHKEWQKRLQGRGPRLKEGGRVGRWLLARIPKNEDRAMFDRG